MGFWRKHDSLEEIWKEMKQAPYDESDKHAIPDVYGRAIQYYLALEYAYDNRRYNIKEVYLWRCLITALALQKLHGLAVSWERVEVLQDDRNSFDCALRYTPDNAFHAGSKWDGKYFYVLKCERTDGKTEEDLLIYSPMSLIYPVADIDDVLGNLPEFAWYDRQNSSVQQLNEKLSVLEKKIIVKWLQNARSGLTVLQTSNKEYQVISHHLLAFEKDLAVSIGAAEEGCFTVVPISEGVRAGDDVFDKCLNNSIEVSINISGCRVEVQDIFADHLYFFELSNRKGNRFSQCEHADNYFIQNTAAWYAFLPLGEEIAKRDEASEVAECISLSYDERSKRIIAELPLSKKNEQWTDLVWKYDLWDNGTELNRRGKAIKSNEKGIPTVAVWPGMITDEWKAYYVFLEEKGSDGSLEIGGTIDYTIQGTNQYVKKAVQAPKAISLIWVKDNHRYSVGVITPKYVRNNADRASVSAVVGVDFGTSSTRVFAKVEGQDKKIEMKIFDDQPLEVIKSEEDNYVNFIKDHFIVHENVEEKVYSIYRRESDDLLDCVEPVMDGLIYHAVENEKLEENNKFMPDLKWGTIAGEEYCRAFIKQLCLHVCALLVRDYHVTSIEWRYALPESMQAGLKDIINNAWIKGAKEYLEACTKLNHTFKNAITESEAASRYFLLDGENPQVNSTKGYLIVDIGGGSTDIAFWQRQSSLEMVWHSSIKVAGRSMFTKWLAEVMETLGRMAVANTMSPMNIMIESMNQINFMESLKLSFTERILNEHYEDLFEAYEMYCVNGNSGEQLDRFRNGITQSVAILMFALGYQTEMLFEKDILKREEDGGSFVISFGGMGSAILKWVDASDDKEKLRQMFLRGVTVAGGDDGINAKVKVNDYPKVEVAKGLLENSIGRENNCGTLGSAPQITKALCESVLISLKTAYQDIFASEGLSSLQLEKDQIINLLDSYGAKGCAPLEFFMQVVYEQHLLNR